jgi:hypothetical protein
VNQKISWSQNYAAIKNMSLKYIRFDFFMLSISWGVKGFLILNKFMDFQDFSFSEQNDDTKVLLTFVETVLKVQCFTNLKRKIRQGFVDYIGIFSPFCISLKIA